VIKSQSIEIYFLPAQPQWEVSASSIRATLNSQTGPGDQSARYTHPCVLFSRWRDLPARLNPIWCRGEFFCHGSVQQR